MTGKIALLATIALKTGQAWAQGPGPEAGEEDTGGALTAEASGGTTEGAAPAATDSSEVATEGVAEADAEAPSGTPNTPSYAGLRVSRRVPSSGDSNESYWSRYLAEPNLWEVGLFTGLFFPAFDHNLKVASLPQQPYKEVNLTLGARLAYFPLSFVGAEVEASVSPSATRDTNKSALLYAVRAHAILQFPLYSVTPFALIGGGILGAVSEPMGHDGDPAFHFGVGAKAPLNHIVSLRLDLRDTLTQQGNGAPQGAAAHNFETLLGATFTFERTPKSMPVPDADFDGLYDSEDSCPDVGALTVDGCPAGNDADGDGFLDGDDLCPNERGAPGSDCPLPAGGAPPVPPKAAVCGPDQVQGPEGCVSSDPDGDHIVGGADRCPNEPETENGYEDADGCPDSVPEAIKQFTGVIQGIAFTKGEAKISEDSLSVLDGAAQVMREYPAIRLEVSGHSSSDGPLRANQKLSEARAQAVADYLKSKGVKDGQLLVRGAGPSEPIADNSTAKGRAQNRRIEFRVLTK